MCLWGHAPSGSDGGGSSLASPSSWCMFTIFGVRWLVDAMLQSYGCLLCFLFCFVVFFSLCFFTSLSLYTSVSVSKFPLFMKTPIILD